jgi:predicted Zn-dependent protease with MMP-like domain
MIQVTDEEFKTIIAEAMDRIPEKYASRMNNMAIIWEDEPSPEQRERLHMQNGSILFGLYEGVPLPKRGGMTNIGLPDKITIFKKSMELTSGDLAELKEQVRHTIWHEVAHYFGLDHEEIAKRERG